MKKGVIIAIVVSIIVVGLALGLGLGLGLKKSKSSDTPSPSPGLSLDSTTKIKKGRSTEGALTGPRRGKAVTLPDGTELLTPSLVKGSLLSVVVPLDKQETVGEFDPESGDPGEDPANQEKQGVVVFGERRPDLAGDDAELFSFELSDSAVTTVPGTLKPINIDTGAFDVTKTPYSHALIILCGTLEMTIGEREVRVACANVTAPEDSQELTMGDVQLKQDGVWKWYDTEGETFTATRPSSPYQLSDLADFQDEGVPSLQYSYIQPPTTTTTDWSSLDSADSVTVTLSFNVGAMAWAKSSPSDDADWLTSFQIIEFNNEQRQDVWQGGNNGLTVSLDVAFE